MFIYHHTNVKPWHQTICKCVHIKLSQQYQTMISNHMWQCSHQIITPIMCDDTKLYGNESRSNYHTNIDPWCQTICECVNMKLLQQWWATIVRYKIICEYVQCQIITPILTHNTKRHENVFLSNYHINNKPYYQTIYECVYAKLS